MLSHPTWAPFVATANTKGYSGPGTLLGLGESKEEDRAHLRELTTMAGMHRLTNTA